MYQLTCNGFVAKGREALKRLSRGAAAAGGFLLRRWRALAVCGVAALLVLVLAGAGAFFWIRSMPIESGQYLTVTRSPEILDRHGRLLFAFLNEEEQWCFERDLDAISPYLLHATVAAEDQRFYSHPGVDAVAVCRAASQNLWRRRVVSGASTLTMQVVKLSGRCPRSLRGKMAQVADAIRLDGAVSKQDILRAYLNRAPYGLNLTGCEAAARRFFGKPASELTLAEAALLAGLPKAPGTLNPLDYPEAALRRRDYVLGRMRQEGWISPAQYDAALAQGTGASWHDFPRYAPHLAMTIRGKTAQAGQLRTTLDRDLQASTEALLSHAMKRFEGGVTNGAAIVIDVQSANILARAGSADFFETPGGGQVDACTARRSPGSALKPFTYGLAMDRQCLYACEMLHDGSVDYGLYSPENYDKELRGVVSAAYALQRSLNVPAVNVLDRIGAEALHAFLQEGGLSTLTRTPDHYGLGLTLGNCEVRLDQLSGLYCMLANLGEYRPLKTGDPTNAAVPRRLLTRGTCLKLYEMLEAPLPDDLSRGLVQAVGVTPRVCWKTGTSTGHRDAWAFVFNRHYVVGVWLGNNDGRSSRWLVGGRAALPLAGRIFRALAPKASPAWPAPEDDVHEIEVCAVTGLPASKWCRHTRRVALPRSQYLHRRCAVHIPGPDGVVEHWPGKTAGWDLACADENLQSIENRGQARTEALRIVAPANDAEYVLTGEATGDRVRLASTHDETSSLYWYLNGRYVGVSSPERKLQLDLSPGSHRLTCMTEAGVTDTVAFAVMRPAGDVRFRP